MSSVLHHRTSRATANVAAVGPISVIRVVLPRVAYFITTVIDSFSISAMAQLGRCGSPLT